jgi:hypothetical protein
VSVAAAVTHPRRPHSPGEYAPLRLSSSFCVPAQSMARSRCSKLVKRRACGDAPSRPPGCARNSASRICVLTGYRTVTPRGDLGNATAGNLGNLLVGKVTVHLESPGGALIPALQIGEYVRLKGWSTFVPDECYSACASIWLAGVPRTMPPQARIGFHAASVNGEEKGRGNALVGAYMTRLGLGYGAIGWATDASPADLALLTPSKAKELGIDLTVLEPDKHANAQPAAPAVPSPDRFGTTCKPYERPPPCDTPQPRPPRPPSLTPSVGQVKEIHGDAKWC